MKSEVLRKLLSYAENHRSQTGRPGILFKFEGGEYFFIDIKDLANEYKAVGEASNMPASNGGFTMAVFHGSDVPPGTILYIKETE